jgi:hypothetical protein
MILKRRKNSMIPVLQVKNSNGEWISIPAI